MSRSKNCKSFFSTCPFRNDVLDNRTCGDCEMNDDVRRGSIVAKRASLDDENGPTGFQQQLINWIINPSGIVPIVNAPFPFPSSILSIGTIPEAASIIPAPF